MYECMYVCMFVRNYVRNYVCMYVCMYACMHACMYVCMYVSPAPLAHQCCLSCVWFSSLFASRRNLFPSAMQKIMQWYAALTPPPPSTNAIFENNCTTPVIHKPIIPNLNLQSLVNIKLRWSHDTIVFRWLCFLSHQTIHVLSQVMLQRTNLQHNRLVEMFNLTIQLVSAIQFEIFKSWRLDAHGAYCFSDSAYPIWHTACRIPNTVKY